MKNKWQILGVSGDYTVWDTIDNTKTDCIATVWRTPKAEKHARLIAAAPDLLAALERIARAHDSGNNGAYMGEAVLCEMFAMQARAAIAKAKGE